MVNLKKINCINKAYLDSKHEVLVFGYFENGILDVKQMKLDALLEKKISKAIALDGFKGKDDKKIIIYGNNDIKRIVFFGLGKKNKYTTDKARSIASKILGYVNDMDLSSVNIDADSFNFNKKGIAQAFCEGLVLGSYVFNEYKTDNDKKNYVNNISIFGDVNRENVNKGYTLGISVSFARDLGNHPANVVTPSYLSKEATSIANNVKEMTSDVFNLNDIKKMGMGAFYGVAQGAKEPAKMIIVEYNGGNKKQKPIALVGKGLTFDSGGISIKPSPSMDEMKFDMCGSATVLGVLKAVAELKPKINIVFAIGSTENMPDGNAQRPGDIVTAYNGKTIEVLNTDAEGRLVLADVLAYIDKKYSPASILDFATLTGAVLVALGNRASGVMGNSSSLMKEVIKASEISSEKVWELPLWDEYTKEIKGKYADIQNIGQARLAGTITAGSFLKEFVGDTPWVHMDIAGTAWGPKEPAYQPKIGATGVAVRLVYQFIENQL